MPESSFCSPPSKLSELRGLDGRFLFEEVPCYISIQDRDFRVLQANRKLVEEIGDPLSRHCYEVYKGSAERCPVCPVARTFDDGEEHCSQEKIFDRHNLPHDVVVHTRALRNPSGEVIAAMEIFTDITVQKELEYRLHESLIRYHNLFDLVPCYISVQDRDFRIVEANQLFRDSFGGRPGERCYEIYKRLPKRCSKCPVAETFEDGRTHESEELLVDNSGKEVRVVVHTAPIRNLQGEITSVMEISDDITELRALQDKLALVGGLVGGTAHSIKNVLEGLRGGVYIANLGLRDNNMTDIRTGWTIVERNLVRISSMIMDMLYCAKDRSPRQLPVSLPRLTREVIDMFSPRAKEYGICLETEICEIDSILADPKDIHALLSNLVSNAIDACVSDPDELKEHRAIVRLLRQEDEIVIEVEDNGVGMDEETRGKLFATFFSTKGAFGTGLGHLVCRKVAAEHGGTISVRSAPGQGSTFTVRLPAEASS